MSTDATYQACFSREEEHITIVRSIPAGISGPWGTIPADASSTAEALDAALLDAGYSRTSREWTLHISTGHWCDIEKVA